MKVWIVQVGEPLPLDPGHPRLLRSGILAEHLTARGHDVLWWAAAFDHRAKQQRPLPEQPIQAAERLAIVPLHSPGYRRNISLSRIRDHYVLAARFRALSGTQPPPDVIHCGYPTIEIALEAARYGRQHGVPVVADCRDLWPDIFLDVFPAAIQKVARRLLRSKFDEARGTFRLATAITGHAPGFVQFGLTYAGRAAGPLDRAFAFGYPDDEPQPSQIEAGRRFWRERGVHDGDGIPTICFFGTFGAQRALDLQVPVLAARMLNRNGVQARIVLCGEGPRFEACRKLGEGVPGLIMPGWVGWPEIWTLMRMSYLGLIPYLPARDFTLSVPNKAIEYLSAALPVVTSLTGGYLHEVLETAGCGLFYKGGDPKALAEVLRDAISKPTTVADMSCNAARLFGTEYAAGAVYGAMVDHLEQVAREGRSA